MNIAGTQVIWVLALAAVLAAYSSVIFRAFKRIVRAAGVFFEAKRSAAAHAGRAEAPPVRLDDHRHKGPWGAPSQETRQRFLIERCRLFLSRGWIHRNVVELMRLRRASSAWDARQARSDRCNVKHVWRWPGPPATPARPYEAIGLVLASTAAVIVAITCWLMLAMGSNSSTQVITTGAHEAFTTRLPDGSVLFLSADSTLKVALTDQHWGARLIEGEAVFDVPANSRGFIVETVLLTATAAPGAKFRVAIGSSVELDVYEGGVKVSRRGAKAGAAALLLHKGDSYRVPIGEAEAPFAMAAASQKSLAAGVRSRS